MISVFVSAAGFGAPAGSPAAARPDVPDAESFEDPLLVEQTFGERGGLGSVRKLHTATLLPNGKVLIAGGESASTYLGTAELYDPATGTFSATAGPMTALRSGHTATLLPNGKVLIAGGQHGTTLNTAELFDPLTATFTATTGPLTAARVTHTATLLADGKVLLAGGEDSAELATAETYDPGTDSFTATSAPMAQARAYHTATLLPNGKVLIAGGTNGAVLASAELYDPATRAFTATAGQMGTTRFHHTATLLSDGKVLIGAGSDGPSPLFTAELYAPASATFTAVPANMTTSRYDHSATLLPDGKVLFAGGYSLNAAEIYDPSGGGTFTAKSGMTSVRFNHTATLLAGGSVLIAGGRDNTSVLGSVEIYESPAGTFASTTTMGTTRVFHVSVLLPDGKVLIAGGTDGGPGPSSSTADLFDVSNGTFTPTNTPMGTGRLSFTATLLPDGRVLLAGGNGRPEDDPSKTAEVFDPATASFTPTTGSMKAVRSAAAATLLANGSVLITGGSSDSSPGLATAELYVPATDTFRATPGTMVAGRKNHTSTLLPDGKVLIAGGYNGSLTLGTAELYDPATGTFANTNGPMISPRTGHTATLLPSGTVLIAGGSNSAYLSTVELYDPASGTFTLSDTTMGETRKDHTATLLPSGNVLITGGVAASYRQSAELYDPSTGTFTATATTLTTPRASHRATLLRSGQVLLTGGMQHLVYLTSAELYDPSLGFSNSRRPVVSSVTNPLCLPANLALSGTRFTGDSAGSGGATNDSATNMPLLRLQRVDGEATRFALSQSASASSFFSRTLSSLASGRYRAAIVSNAIPSIEQIIDIETTPILATYDDVSLALSSTTTLPPSSLPPGFNGAFYPQVVEASGAFTGGLAINGSSGAVTVTTAGPVGDFTITVSSSTSCGSPSTTFTLKVIGPPASVTASGGAVQSAAVNTAFAPLSATVTDSAGHPLNNVAVNFTAPGSGASATFPAGGSANTNVSGVATIIPSANGATGSYNANAVVGALTALFALTNTPATPTNVVATASTPTSVSITWSGTSGATYEVVRIAAGGINSVIGSSASGSLPDTSASANTAYLYKVRAIAPGVSPFSAPDLATTVIFTDPALLPSTSVKSVHIEQLRTAVDAVRALAGLSAGTYADPTLIPAVTVIKASHILTLRTALNAARSSGSLSLPANTYTTSDPVAFTTKIFAADLIDLRNGVH